DPDVVPAVVRVPVLANVPAPDRVTPVSDPVPAKVNVLPDPPLTVTPAPPVRFGPVRCSLPAPVPPEKRTDPRVPVAEKNDAPVANVVAVPKVTRPGIGPSPRMSNDPEWVCEPVIVRKVSFRTVRVPLLTRWLTTVVPDDAAVYDPPA